MNFLKNKRNMKNTTKTLLKVFTVAVACLSFQTCEYWKNGDKFYNDVQEQVRVAGADKIKVDCSYAQSNWGSINPGMDSEQKIEVGFKVTQVPVANYAFHHWAAFRKSDFSKKTSTLFWDDENVKDDDGFITTNYLKTWAPKELPENVVKFYDYDKTGLKKEDILAADYNNEINDVGVYISNHLYITDETGKEVEDPIVIVPVVAKRMTLDTNKINPEQGNKSVVRNQRITIAFNKQIDFSTFVDYSIEPSQITNPERPYGWNKDAISIKFSDDYGRVIDDPYDEYFELPVYDPVKPKQFTISVKKPMPQYNLTEITISATVQDKDGFSMAEDILYTFTIGNKADNDPPVLTELSGGRNINAENYNIKNFSSVRNWLEYDGYKDNTGSLDSTKAAAADITNSTDITKYVTDYDDENVINHYLNHRVTDSVNIYLVIKDYIDGRMNDTTVDSDISKFVVRSRLLTDSQGLPPKDADGNVIQGGKIYENESLEVDEIPFEYDNMRYSSNTAEFFYTDTDTPHLYNVPIEDRLPGYGFTYKFPSDLPDGLVKIEIYAVDATLNSGENTPFALYVVKDTTQPSVETNGSNITYQSDSVITNWFNATTKKDLKIKVKENSPIKDNACDILQPPVMYWAFSTTEDIQENSWSVIDNTGATTKDLKDFADSITEQGPISVYAQLCDDLGNKSAVESMQFAINYDVDKPGSVNIVRTVEPSTVYVDGSIYYSQEPQIKFEFSAVDSENNIAATVTSSGIAGFFTLDNGDAASVTAALKEIDVGNSTLLKLNKATAGKAQIVLNAGETADKSKRSYYLYAVDQALNASAEKVPVTLIQDTTGPEITVTDYASWVYNKDKAYYRNSDTLNEKESQPGVTGFVKGISEGTYFYSKAQQNVPFHVELNDYDFNGGGYASGAKEFYISNNQSQKYEVSSDITLAAGDYIIYASDNLGNITESVVIHVLQDKASPVTESVVIYGKDKNNVEQTTSSVTSTVDIAVTVKDIDTANNDTGVRSFTVSGDAKFTAPSTIKRTIGTTTDTLTKDTDYFVTVAADTRSETITFKQVQTQKATYRFSGATLYLESGEGNNTIYCDVLDATGNASVQKSGSIFCDSTPPVISNAKVVTLDASDKTNNNSTKLNRINITFDMLEKVSGVTKVFAVKTNASSANIPSGQSMFVSTSAVSGAVKAGAVDSTNAFIGFAAPSISANVQSVTVTDVTLDEGEKAYTIYLFAVDDAGNLSAPVSVKVNYDTTAPVVNEVSIAGIQKLRYYEDAEDESSYKYLLPSTYFSAIDSAADKIPLYIDFTETAAGVEYITLGGTAVIQENTELYTAGTAETALVKDTDYELDLANNRIHMLNSLDAKLKSNTTVKVKLTNIKFTKANVSEPNTISVVLRDFAINENAPYNSVTSGTLTGIQNIYADSKKPVISAFTAVDRGGNAESGNKLSTETTDDQTAKTVANAGYTNEEYVNIEVTVGAETTSSVTGSGIKTVTLTGVTFTADTKIRLGDTVLAAGDAGVINAIAAGGNVITFKNAIKNTYKLIATNVKLATTDDGSKTVKAILTDAVSWTSEESTYSIVLDKAAPAWSKDVFSAPYSNCTEKVYPHPKADETAKGKQLAANGPYYFYTSYSLSGTTSAVLGMHLTDANLRSAATGVYFKKADTTNADVIKTGEKKSTAYNSAVFSKTNYSYWSAFVPDSTIYTVAVMDEAGNVSAAKQFYVVNDTAAPSVKNDNNSDTSYLDITYTEQSDQKDSEGNQNGELWQIFTRETNSADTLVNFFRSSYNYSEGFLDYSTHVKINVPLTNYKRINFNPAYSAIEYYAVNDSTTAPASTEKLDSNTVNVWNKWISFAEGTDSLTVYPDMFNTRDVIYLHVKNSTGVVSHIEIRTKANAEAGKHETWSIDDSNNYLGNEDSICSYYSNAGTLSSPDLNNHDGSFVTNESTKINYINDTAKLKIVTSEDVSFIKNTTVSASNFSIKARIVAYESSDGQRNAPSKSYVDTLPESNTSTTAWVYKGSQTSADMDFILPYPTASDNSTLWICVEDIVGNFTAEMLEYTMSTGLAANHWTYDNVAPTVIVQNGNISKEIQDISNNFDDIQFLISPYGHFRAYCGKNNQGIKKIWVPNGPTSGLKYNFVASDTNDSCGTSGITGYYYSTSNTEPALSSYNSYSEYDFKKIYTSELSSTDEKYVYLNIRDFVGNTRQYLIGDGNVKFTLDNNNPSNGNNTAENKETVVGEYQVKKSLNSSVSYYVRTSGSNLDSKVITVDGKQYLKVYIDYTWNPDLNDSYGSGVCCYEFNNASGYNFTKGCGDNKDNEGIPKPYILIPIEIAGSVTELGPYDVNIFDNVGNASYFKIKVICDNQAPDFTVKFKKYGSYHIYDSNVYKKSSYINDDVEFIYPKTGYDIKKPENAVKLFAKGSVVLEYYTTSDDCYEAKLEYGTYDSTTKTFTPNAGNPVKTISEGDIKTTENFYPGELIGNTTDKWNTYARASLSDFAGNTTSYYFRLETDTTAPSVSTITDSCFTGIINTYYDPENGNVNYYRSGTNNRGLKYDSSTNRYTIGTMDDVKLKLDVEDASGLRCYELARNGNTSFELITLSEPVTSYSDYLFKFPNRDTHTRYAVELFLMDMLGNYSSKTVKYNNCSSWLSDTILPNGSITGLSLSTNNSSESKYFVYETGSNVGFYNSSLLSNGELKIKISYDGLSDGVLEREDGYGRILGVYVKDYYTTENQSKNNLYRQNTDLFTLNNTGLYECYDFKYVDYAGNVGTDTKNVTFYRDTEPPVMNRYTAELVDTTDDTQKYYINSTSSVLSTSSTSPTKIYINKKESGKDLTLNLVFSDKTNSGFERTKGIKSIAYKKNSGVWYTATGSHDTTSKTTSCSITLQNSCIENTPSSYVICVKDTVENETYYYVDFIPDTVAPTMKFDSIFFVEDESYSRSYIYTDLNSTTNSTLSTSEDSPSISYNNIIGSEDDYYWFKIVKDTEEGSQIKEYKAEFTNSTEWNISNTGNEVSDDLSSFKKIIYSKIDGRKNKITVYDNVGNSTSYYIKNVVDKTAPSLEQFVDDKTTCSSALDYVTGSFESGTMSIYSQASSISLTVKNSGIHTDSLSGIKGYSKVDYSSNAAGFADFEVLSANITVEEGNNIFYLYDNVGNMTRCNLKLIVDDQPPVLNVTGAFTSPNGVNVDNTPTYPAKDSNEIKLLGEAKENPLKIYVKSTSETFGFNLSSTDNGKGSNPAVGVKGVSYYEYNASGVEGSANYMTDNTIKINNSGHDGVGKLVRINVQDLVLNEKDYFVEIIPDVTGPVISSISINQALYDLTAASIINADTDIHSNATVLDLTKKFLVKDASILVTAAYSDAGAGAASETYTGTVTAGDTYSDFVLCTVEDRLSNETQFKIHLRKDQGVTGTTVDNTAEGKRVYSSGSNIYYYSAKASYVSEIPVVKCSVSNSSTYAAPTAKEDSLPTDANGNLYLNYIDELGTSGNIRITESTLICDRTPPSLTSGLIAANDYSSTAPYYTDGTVTGSASTGYTQSITSTRNVLTNAALSTSSVSDTSGFYKILASSTLSEDAGLTTVTLTDAAGDGATETTVYVFDNVGNCTPVKLAYTYDNGVLSITDKLITDNEYYTTQKPFSIDSASTATAVTLYAKSFPVTVSLNQLSSSNISPSENLLGYCSSSDYSADNAVSGLFEIAAAGSTSLYVFNKIGKKASVTITAKTDATAPSVSGMPFAEHTYSDEEPYSISSENWNASSKTITINSSEDKRATFTSKVLDLVTSVISDNNGGSGLLGYSSSGTSYSAITSADIVSTGTVYVWDKAGNVTEITIDLQFIDVSTATLDTSAAVITAVTSLDPAKKDYVYLNGKTVYYNGNKADNTTDLLYTVTGITGGVSPYTVAGKIGSNTLSVTDSLGLSGSISLTDSSQLTFTSDTTAPTLPNLNNSNEYKNLNNGASLTTCKETVMTYGVTYYESTVTLVIPGISDNESGIGSYSYVISTSESTPTSEQEPTSWNQVTLNNGQITVGLPQTSMFDESLFLAVRDKVGNVSYTQMKNPKNTNDGWWCPYIPAASAPTSSVSGKTVTLTGFVPTAPLKKIVIYGGAKTTSATASVDGKSLSGITCENNNNVYITITFDTAYAINTGASLVITINGDALNSGTNIQCYDYKNSGKNGKTMGTASARRAANRLVSGATKTGALSEAISSFSTRFSAVEVPQTAVIPVTGPEAVKKEIAEAFLELPVVAPVKKAPVNSRKEITPFTSRKTKDVVNQSFARDFASEVQPEINAMPSIQNNTFFDEEEVPEVKAVNLMQSDLISEPAAEVSAKSRGLSDWFKIAALLVMISGVITLFVIQKKKNAGENGDN